MQFRKIKNNFFKKAKVLFSILLVLALFLGILFSFYKYFLQKGKPISPLAQKELAKQNNIEEILQKNKIEYSKISVATDSSYLVILKEGEEINLSSQKDLSAQISSLQLIISSLTIEGKKFKRIDFRFDKPIVVF